LEDWRIGGFENEEEVEFSTGLLRRISCQQGSPVILGLFIFKACSLAASKMLLVGAFAPIPKGSNMNSPACHAGRPMKPPPKPEGLEFDLEPSHTLCLFYSSNLMVGGFENEREAIRRPLHALAQG
jgi:hypothetical protein